MMKNLLLLFVLALVYSFPALATMHVINQSGTTFNPANMSVSVGDTVRFQWNNGSHNTVSTSVPAGANPWNSPLNPGNTSYEYEVLVAGEYAYECTFHNGQVGAFTATEVVNSVQIVRQVAMDMNVRTTANGNLLVHILHAAGDRAVVTMLDLTGREVAMLHQGAIASDDYTIRQDVTSFQRGIYLVRFQEGAHITTRKVLIQ
jgi:plastocyanin